MNLSPNFTLKELTASDYAVRNGIDNTPSSEIIESLKRTCQGLELIRALVGGKPITIKSGYRCPKVNTGIGGARNSQHVVGEAADITIHGISNKELYNRIKTNLSHEVDQCISEFPDIDGEPAWIHVSFSEHGRGEFLIATKVNGKTLYQKD